MKYTIVNVPFDKKNEFLDKVNALIKKGWKPQGGICYSNFAFAQAMIKENKPKGETNETDNLGNADYHVSIHPR